MIGLILWLVLIFIIICLACEGFIIELLICLAIAGVGYILIRKIFG